MDYAFNRRTFITAAGALLSLKGATAFSGANSAHSSDIKLGVASYSLRKLSRAQAIAALKELKTPYLNIKEFHLLYNSAPPDLAAGRREFEDAGLKIVGGGTISLKEDSDADVRKYFEYAKQSGMPLMVIAPTQQTMPRIERFVKEYNIKAAIHNHGPEDKFFPAPQDAMKVVKNMDPRVGTNRRGCRPIDCRSRPPLVGHAHQRPAIAVRQRQPMPRWRRRHAGRRNFQAAEEDEIPGHGQSGI